MFLVQKIGKLVESSLMTHAEKKVESVGFFVVGCCCYFFHPEGQSQPKKEGRR